jgi:hypothetical protein
MSRYLSDILVNHVEQLFDPVDVDEAKDLLRQIRTTGGGGQASNRCEIAALKVSRGSIERLKSAVKLYHLDWRDLLMSADFGSDTKAHENWVPSS